MAHKVLEEFYLNGAVAYIDDTVVYGKDEKNSCKYGLGQNGQVQCQTQSVHLE